MAAIPAKGIGIVPAQRRCACSRCGGIGHNARTCGRRRQPDAAPLRNDSDEPPAPAVDQVRRRLRVINGRARGKTIAARRLSRAEVLEGELTEYPEDVELPITRAECAEMPHPCPLTRDSFR